MEGQASIILQRAYTVDMRIYRVINTYGWPMLMFGLLCLFALLDFGLYYALDGKSPVPFYIACAITGAGFILTITAIVQTYRHRKDSEKW